MEVEYEALIRNQTWEFVPLVTNQHLDPSTFSLTIYTHLCTIMQKLKARLVAKGFQQTLGVDNFNTINPVVKIVTIRIILTLVVSYN